MELMSFVEMESQSCGQQLLVDNNFKNFLSNGP